MSAVAHSDDALPVNEHLTNGDAVVSGEMELADMSEDTVHSPKDNKQVNAEVMEEIKTESAGSTQLSEDEPTSPTGSKDDKKALEYMKERYEGKKEPLGPKVIREPKKLDIQWGKQTSQEEGTLSDELRSPSLPKEQDLIALTTPGTETIKKQYESRVERQSSQTKWEVNTEKRAGTPVNWQTVEKVAPPEITKNVRAMFESGALPDIHKIEKTKVDIPPPESGVYENEPIELEGVVRSRMDGENDADNLPAGMARNIRGRFENPQEDGQPENKVINIVEGEGQIVENEPEVRTDVVHGYDEDKTEGPAAGLAKQMRERFVNYNPDKPKENKVIKLYEDNEAGPTICENEPQQREGVVRETDADEIRFERGKAKKLASKFLTEEEDRWTERKPIEIERDSQPIILESEPAAKPEGVISADDVPDSEKDMRFEKGRSKKMASLFSGGIQEEQPKIRRQPIKLELAENGPTVLENEPELPPDDIVRGGQPSDDIIVTKRGHIRNLATQFLQGEDDNHQRKPREMIKIERSEEPTVLENEPEAPSGDIVRGEQYVDEALMACRSRGVRSVWAKREQEPEDETSPSQSQKPQWLLEFEAAKEQGNSGVFENVPEQRDDSGYVPDEQIIPSNLAKNMKSRWMKSAEDDDVTNKPPPELVRFTPPRELTPPSLKQPDYQSTQQVTLGSDATVNGINGGPAADNPAGPPHHYVPQTSQQQQQQQQQQKKQQQRGRTQPRSKQMQQQQRQFLKGQIQGLDGEEEQDEENPPTGIANAVDDTYTPPPPPSHTVKSATMLVLK